jgi:branched-chain amino acid transport system substrate-binding protein
MTGITRRTFGLGALALPLASQLRIPRAFAQDTVKIGLLAPMSGLYARPGQVMRMGAELGVEDVNAAGGIEALGGAKLELVVLDCGDTTEKAKNAAQRMVADYPDLIAATGSYLSSFTLAVTEVTERAGLPMLTLSYSDMITARGFKYIFQTSASSGSQPPEGAFVIMAQLGTLYYFGHFLVLLPLLGSFERPKPLPASISEPVLAGAAATPAE